MADKIKVTLDGDKDSYTPEEITRLLNEVDVDVYMTQPDGEVTKIVIEEKSP